MSPVLCLVGPSGSEFISFYTIISMYLTLTDVSSHLPLHTSHSLSLSHHRLTFSNLVMDVSRTVALTTTGNLMRLHVTPMSFRTRSNSIVFIIDAVEANPFIMEATLV